MAIDGLGKGVGNEFGIQKFKGEKIASRICGEYYSKQPDDTPQMKKNVEDVVNLVSTEAGKVALQLAGYDAKDILDGKVKVKIDEIRIPAKTWNAYAEPLGGKTVTNYIDVISAMNSISDYSVKGQDIQVKLSQASEEATKAADAKQKHAEENGGNSFGY